MEIFFDKDFTKNIDSNPYLMCFTNGVFDFKTKEFRDGYPQDYITKTTGISYIKFNPVAHVDNIIYKMFPFHFFLYYKHLHTHLSLDYQFLYVLLFFDFLMFYY